LPQTILEHLQDGVHGLGKDKPFILVGHSLLSDMKILSEIGVDVAQHPNFRGTLDTCVLGGKILGKWANLRDLLRILSIPCTWKAEGAKEDCILHCAGNDAHLTLRALLALIHRKDNGVKTEWLQELAEEPLPELVKGKGKVMDKGEEEDDWVLEDLGLMYL
jgi:hypothetical protein